MATGDAEATRKIALIIGNDSYEHLPVLRKAVADAQSYGKLLEAHGFDEVTLRTDLTRAATDDALAA